MCKKYYSKVIKKSNLKKERRTKFLAVDLWQKEFSDVSVKAVCEIFADKNGLNLSNVNKHSFSKYLNILRKEENPDYEIPNYGTGVA